MGREGIQSRVLPTKPQEELISVVHIGILPSKEIQRPRCQSGVVSVHCSTLVDNIGEHPFRRLASLAMCIDVIDLLEITQNVPNPVFGLAYAHSSRITLFGDCNVGKPKFTFPVWYKGYHGWHGDVLSKSSCLLPSMTSV
ncbi:hypothetical protein HNY73_022189 [Argiope bruennichi]|uniref:Uncharacterized protein n=1 Tax=Argiope bruennichi TaxID=94029 RepID=A0A8T0E3Q2_ARGBR|nr:hypothetical protein HNY73_022189 [Argiope bruennichi]